MQNTAARPAPPRPRYDLKGIRISSDDLHRGIYIRGGKKIFVK